MPILCDTSSILMLIRIAPEMFLNESYDCYTIKEVWEEMFQTTKFKNKYPWRVNFKKNIKILPSTIGKQKLTSLPNL